MNNTVSDWNSYLDRVYGVFGFRERPFQRIAWEGIRDSLITIIEAPTGYGKTVLSEAFTLYTLTEEFKSIVAYPLRSLLEDQFEKFKQLYDRLGLGGVVDTRYMHHLGSRYFVKPVTLTTIDTLSLTLFGLEPLDLDKALRNYFGAINYSLGHYLFSKATTLLSNIVLDEAHLLADTTKSLNFLIALLRIALQNNMKIVMLTATLPSALAELLRNIFDDSVRIIWFDESVDPGFTSERHGKRIELSIEKVRGVDKYSYIINWLIDKQKVFEDDSKAILVFNTVDEAVKMYSLIRSDERIRGAKILLHSRFRDSDRRSRVEELRRIAKSGDEYVLVTTQVIEAGVDISSNIFITDIAPANSLIQRLGRFLRYPGERRGYVLIWYEDLGGKRYYKVYDRGFVEKTIEYIVGSEYFNPHLPSYYKDLLDHVYVLNDFRIDAGSIRELSTLIFDLASPRRSVKKFLELEGSFIREGLPIPVIIRGVAEEIMGDEYRSMSDYIVSVNRNVLWRNRKCIIGELVRDTSSDNIVSRSIDESILMSNKRLLSEILSSNFIAFIIDAEYSEESGLVFSEKCVDEE